MPHKLAEGIIGWLYEALDAAIIEKSIDICAYDARPKINNEVKTIMEELERQLNIFINSKIDAAKCKIMADVNARVMAGRRIKPEKLARTINQPNNSSRISYNWNPDTYEVTTHNTLRNMYNSTNNKSNTLRNMYNSTNNKSNTLRNMYNSTNNSGKTRKNSRLVRV